MFTRGLFLATSQATTSHYIKWPQNTLISFSISFAWFYRIIFWIAFVSHSPFTQFAENEFSAPNERTWIACKMRAPLVAAAAAEALIIYSDGVQICFVSLKCTQCNELASIQPQPFAVVVTRPQSTELAATWIRTRSNESRITLWALHRENRISLYAHFRRRWHSGHSTNAEVISRETLNQSSSDFCANKNDLQSPFCFAWPRTEYHFVVVFFSFI